MDEWPQNRNRDYPTCNEGLSPSSLGKTGSVVSTTSGKLSSGFHFRNGTMEQHFAESPENFGKFLFHLTFCPDFRLNGSLSRIQQFPDFLETFPRNFLKLNEGKCTHITFPPNQKFPVEHFSECPKSYPKSSLSLLLSAFLEF